MDAFQRAIALAGSQAELAYMLGVVPMAVTNWKRRGVPADCLLAFRVSRVRRRLGAHLGHCA